MQATQICSIEGCERSNKMSHGLCGTHYERWRRHGTTDLLPSRRPSPAERLAAGLERKPNGCLEWTGYTDRLDDSRLVRDRLTFVYGVARAHGATVEDLTGKP